jgi:hypothetical protein
VTGGTQDAPGGSRDAPGGGSGDAPGGSRDAPGGSRDALGGSRDALGGSRDAPGGGSGDAPGGSQDALGGSHDALGGGSGDVLVPLLRRGSWYDSLDVAVPSAPGLPAVSLAPEILIRRDARWLRERSASPVPPLAERREIVTTALRLFTDGEVNCGGLGPQSAGQFRSALWACAGLPGGLTDRWCKLLAAQAAELPASGTAGDDCPTATELTLVALPGNTFTCLESVIEAVLAGRAVWVRPSTREPLSALRLVSALLAAGWPGELIGFYPTARGVLRTLVAVTDRQIVYGGGDVCAELRDVATATVHGPLRVCALVPAEANPAATAAELLPLVAGDGGRFCTTVRAILCLADPEPVTAQLGALLDAIPADPADPCLPLTASADPGLAAATAAAVTERLAPGDRKVTRRPVLSMTGRLTYLAPTLIRLADQPEPATLAWGDPALLGFEAPFPLATVSRVSPAQEAALARTADLVHRLGPATDRAGPEGQSGPRPGSTGLSRASTGVRSL